MLKPDTIVVICAIVLSILLLIATIIYKIRCHWRELRAEDPRGTVYQFSLCCFAIRWADAIVVNCGPPPLWDHSANSWTHC